MNSSEVVVRFDDVSFSYDQKKFLLKEASFSIRKNSKITIMGQNGAGKSTIFKLITGKLKPTRGQININQNSHIALAKQIITHEERELTIKEYFTKALKDKDPHKEIYGVERYINDVLRVVNLQAPIDKHIKDFSGGQQARLLLAYALIQEPEILLLDEPTNNLDHAGIQHLTDFLVNYPKTVIVISHDALFLNSFTDGVLNLDAHSGKTEQFVGDYYDVVERIAAQIEKERMLNVRLEKNIKDRFEKINKLGAKSVKLRQLANRMREDVEEQKDQMVDIRRDDKTLAKFSIPVQHFGNPLMVIRDLEFLKDGKVQHKKVEVELRRGSRIIVVGPNGVGKSTFLKKLIAGHVPKLAHGNMAGHKEGSTINPELKVGYYSQDFSELDFESTPFDLLLSLLPEKDNQKVYETAAKFLIPADVMRNKIGSLSEGQKGLLVYASFTLLQPGLLIMDEPSNHINFRHLPVIAEALNDFAGAILLVSHDQGFLADIRVDSELELG